MAFSPDGKRLASASLDRTVKVWDAATGQETLTLKGHTGWSLSVAFSPDGKRLASASGDRTVKVWDAATGQETLTLKGHTGVVRSVAFSPDGKRLASAESGRDGEGVGRRDRAGNPHPQGAHRRCQQRGVQPRRQAARLRPATDRTVKVWDADDRAGNPHPQGAHRRCVSSVAFSPDGKRLASASGDGTVKVWDAATGQEILHPQGAHRRCRERGVQPRRQAARLRQSGRDGEGVGRRDRAGNPHPQGAHRRGLRAWRSAPTASGSPPPVATGR